VGTANVVRRIVIPESEIEFDFTSASGPGGQHVNKSATAVQLRFDVANSAALPDDVRRRLTKLAGNRMTKDGVLIIEANQYRSQSRNRRDAIERLTELVRQAACRPKKRRRTRPTRSSQERRLQEKQRRSRIKKLRKPPPEY